MRIFYYMLLCYFFAAFPLYAEWEQRSSGEISAESRVFEDDNNSETEDVGFGMFSRLQAEIKNNMFRSSLRMTGRVDRYDADRNFINIEEGWIGCKTSFMNLRVGNQMFNWSAAQAFQPADVLNSRNYDSNIENADKIGEPAASLKVNLLAGTMSFIYMPYYRKAEWPGEHSRLSVTGALPEGMQTGDTVYIDHDGTVSDDRFGHQGAVRLIQSFSACDVSLHAIYHLDRNTPLSALDTTSNVISPLYQRKIQYGGTVQYVWNAAVFRSEFVYRQYQDLDSAVKGRYLNPLTMGPIEETPDHAVVSAGIDYEFDIWDLGMITLMLEGQRVIGLSREEREAIETFQSDIMFGFIWNQNDYLNKTFSLTCIIDTERAYQVLLNSYYSQRINDFFGFTISARRIMANNDDDTVTGLEALDDANYYSFTLSRYF